MARLILIQAGFRILKCSCNWWCNHIKMKVVSNNWWNTRETRSSTLFQLSHSSFLASHAIKLTITLELSKLSLSLVRVEASFNFVHRHITKWKILTFCILFYRSLNQLLIILCKWVFTQYVMSPTWSLNYGWNFLLPVCLWIFFKSLSSWEIWW